MAPPKRKSGGRVTPSGTRPGDRNPAARASRAAAAKTTDGGTHVAASARYTPPIPQHMRESPPWVPALMLGLFLVGGLAIMSRYLVWDSSNIPMLIGLVCLLGGLYTATKWR